MPKRPDYGDATPEDLVVALMKFQRVPLKKHSKADKEKEESDQKSNHDDDSVNEQS